MRALFLLIFALGSSAVFAAPQKGKMFLSWNELSRLSRAQRMEYVRGVAELAAAMEDAQSSYEVSSNYSLDEVKEYFAELQEMLSVLPEAQAQSDSAPSTPAVSSAVPYWDKEKFQKEGVGWNCKGALKFEIGIGTCVFTMNWSGAPTPFYPTEQTCPNGSQRLAARPPNDGAYCVPADSWNALSENSREFLKKGGEYTPEQFVGLDQKQTSDQVLGSLPSAQLQTQLGAGSESQPPAKVAPATEPPLANPAPKEEKIAPAPKPVKCEPPKFSCSESMDPKEKAKLISSFRNNRGDDANVCIYGGFFSKYATNRKKVGTCSPVRKFPPSNKNGCTRRGQVLCNPALFCVGAPDPNAPDKVINPKVICGQRGKNATASCEKQYQELVAKGKYETKDNKGKLRSYKVQACDPVKEMSDSIPPAARQDWDELVAAMQSKYQRWCLGDEGFAALFCKECTIMSEKIHALNSKVKSDLCSANIEPPAPETVKPAAPQEAPATIRDEPVDI